MNELKIFTKEEFGQVRTIEVEGKILFCGNDVAKALGYAEPHKAIARHTRGGTKHPVGVITGIKADGTNAIQEIDMTFIPEGDMYRLIVKSKLPSAEQFESWVFDEILPSIRKHGMYATENTLDNMLNNPDFAIKLFTQLKQEREEKAQLVLRNKDLEHTVEYKTEIITGLTENIDIYKKRDIVNRIVKRKGKDGKGYAGRYKEMYQCFKEVFHVDLTARCEGYNLKVSKNKDKLSVIKYAEMFGHIDGLYEVACKLYESEVEALLDELR